MTPLRRATAAALLAGALTVTQMSAADAASSSMKCESNWCVIFYYDGFWHASYDSVRLTAIGGGKHRLRVCDHRKDYTVTGALVDPDGPQAPIRYRLVPDNMGCAETDLGYRIRKFKLFRVRNVDLFGAPVYESNWSPIPG